MVTCLHGINGEWYMGRMGMVDRGKSMGMG